ncbi:hypothetical protein D3C87_1264840 [compost metagenome]
MHAPFGFVKHQVCLLRLLIARGNLGQQQVAIEYERRAAVAHLYQPGLRDLLGFADMALLQQQLAVLEQ